MGLACSSATRMGRPCAKAGAPSAGAERHRRPLCAASAHSVGAPQAAGGCRQTMRHGAPCTLQRRHADRTVLFAPLRGTAAEGAGSVQGSVSWPVRGAAPRRCRACSARSTTASQSTAPEPAPADCHAPCPSAPLGPPGDSGGEGASSCKGGVEARPAAETEGEVRPAEPEAGSRRGAWAARRGGARLVGRRYQRTAPRSPGRLMPSRRTAFGCTAWRRSPLSRRAAAGSAACRRARTPRSLSANQARRWAGSRGGREAKTRRYLAKRRAAPQQRGQGRRAGTPEGRGSGGQTRTRARGRSGAAHQRRVRNPRTAA